MIRMPISYEDANAIRQKASELQEFPDELSKLPEISDSGGRAYLKFRDKKHMEEWYLNGS